MSCSKCFIEINYNYISETHCKSASHFFDIQHIHIITQLTHDTSAHKLTSPHRLPHHIA
jgi:hypothetical protein